MPDFPSAPKEPPGVQATPYVSQSVPVAQPAVHVAQPPPHYHVSNPSTSQTSASLQQAFNIARTVAKGTWYVELRIQVAAWWYKSSTPTIEMPTLLAYSVGTTVLVGELEKPSLK